MGRVSKSAERRPDGGFGSRGLVDDGDDGMGDAGSAVERRWWETAAAKTGRGRAITGHTARCFACCGSIGVPTLRKRTAPWSFRQNLLKEPHFWKLVHVLKRADIGYPGPWTPAPSQCELAALQGHGRCSASYSNVQTHMACTLVGRKLVVAGWDVRCAGDAADWKWKFRKSKKARGSERCVGVHGRVTVVCR